MKRRILALILGLTLALSLALCASAAEYSTVVTLTVVNKERPISVTVPAALPVSVVDGYVVTATNAAIKNNADIGAVQVTKVVVNSGALTVGDYAAFANAQNSIALELNGCGTLAAGELAINSEAFPVIEAGSSMPIQYNAKVNVTGQVTDMAAATVVFTIAAAEEVVE